MRLGVFARTFVGEAPLAVLGAARAAGFEAVHYNMACSGLDTLPPAVPPEVAGAVRAASEATGVAVVGLSATYNMIHPDERRRAAGREAFAVLAAAAPTMGCRLVTVCTGSRDPRDQWRHHPENATPEAWAAFLAEMRRLLPLADRHGVSIGVEPERGNVVQDALLAERMLDELDHHPRLGIVLDPANLFEDEVGFRRGAVVDEAVDLLAGRIVMTHAKDRQPNGSVGVPGTGLVDFVRLTQRLREVGFDGPLVAHGFDAEKAPAVARHLRACLDRA